MKNHFLVRNKKIEEKLQNVSFKNQLKYFDAFVRIKHFSKTAMITSARVSEEGSRASWKSEDKCFAVERICLNLLETFRCII